MTINRLPLMTVLGVITCFNASVGWSDEIILNGDGTEIRLKADGSWERVSDNIYLDTAEGRRVVLKPDGSWSYVGLAPVIKEDQYRELLVELAVVDAVIKETREKVGSGKNYRTESFTHFNLQLRVADTAKEALSIAQLDGAGFVVSDNRDKVYPVVSVTGDSPSVAPGGSAQLELICEGAPSSFARSKTITIAVDQSVFATERPVELEISYDDIKRQRINL